MPGDSGESPARPSEDDEARPLPLPKLKPWSGWVRQGPSCSRAEQRTGNTTEPAHPDAGPTRTRSSARSPCAHSTRRDTQPASRTRRLWNLREPAVAAPPRPPPRARAPLTSLSPAPPSLAPPRPPSLLVTLNSRESTKSSRKVTPLPPSPGNCTYYTLTSRVPAAQSQFRTAVSAYLHSTPEITYGFSGSKSEVD